MAMTTRVRRWWRLRGQSTVEYSIVAHVILIAGGLGLMLPVPHPRDKGMVSLIGYLFEAMNSYYESIYFVLKSGAM
jgi:hypothetical protein